MEKAVKRAPEDGERQMLRHALATLAYRAGKTLRNAPETFARFKPAEEGRTPVEIIAHMGDLFDWALWLCKGKHQWNNSKPLPWEQEVDRFFQALQNFDEYLVSDMPLGFPAEKLFQGPVADALTHTGQLAMLRRMAGCAMKGENYFAAEITAGRVGKQQAAPKVEFD